MIEERLKEGFEKFCPEKELPKDAECEMIEFEKKHYLVELFPRGGWAGIGRIWEVIPNIPKGKPMSILEVNLMSWKEKDVKEREYLAKLLEPFERKDELYKAIESTKYFDHFN